MPNPASGAPRRRTSMPALLLVAAMAALIGLASSATAALVVTGKQIKDDSITTRDLRDGGLSGANFRDESLTPDDFATLVEGPRGPQGDRGPTGPAGTAGLVYVIEPTTIPKEGTKAWVATCPDGTRVLSGGGSSGKLAVLPESAPADDAGSGWAVVMTSYVKAPITAYAWALCVKA
ncbi:hypothetical protein HNR19_002883 [Nocardioides thalensis]|uniref:Collagen-like protein n=1 Tax=Nocardioides thalensis TaxID=1914755 RepID=A0A853C3B8_9ACTN|nr:hypothetical protein [Nocardioides thalensis]NYJ02185.1 hypothetical protein [Nocardioides thalensis]